MCIWKNDPQSSLISVSLLERVEKETDLYKVSPPCFGCVCGWTCMNVFCIFIVQAKPECKRPVLYAKQPLQSSRRAAARLRLLAGDRSDWCLIAKRFDATSR